VQSSPIVGFGVNDNQIRGLTRFIKSMSRESNNENDVQVAGILFEMIQTQGCVTSFYILYLSLEKAVL